MITLKLIISFAIGMFLTIALAFKFAFKKSDNSRESEIISKINFLRVITIFALLFLICAFVVQHYREENSVYLIIAGFLSLTLILVLDGYKKWKRKIKHILLKDSKLLDSKNLKH